MRGPPPPLRFLALILCGWICLRGGVLASGWWEEQAAAPAPAPQAAIAAAPEAPGPAPLPPASEPQIERQVSPGGLPLITSKPARSMAVVATLPAPAYVRAPDPAPTVVSLSAAPIMPAALSPSTQGPHRWSGSAWLFVREGQADALAPGGMLGGSQAGARLTYRLNDDADRPLALSGRVYAPLDDVAAAEAALGIDWRPLKSAPVHLLAERRQALGKEGRSAFSLTAYGGVSDERLGPLRLDAYAQAGVVGARSRDLFADGSARLSLPVGNVKVGAGAWGAAQPGVERLDVGPQASIALPVAGTQVIVAADWRMRVAGEARPESGPTLTISTGF